MLTTPLPKHDILTNTNPNIKYDGTITYAYAKRGQVIVIEELAKIYKNITFVTAHPGWTNTKAVNDAFDTNTIKYLQPLRSEWEGTEGITWLLTTNKNNLISSEFYLDRKIQKKHLSGPFMTEGTYTRNSETEIIEFMKQLKIDAEL